MTTVIKSNQMEQRVRLTRNRRRSLESGSDLRVHGDQHVLLLGHLGVSFLDAGLHPGRELVAHDAISDVN